FPAIGGDGSNLCVIHPHETRGAGAAIPALRAVKAEAVLVPGLGHAMASLRQEPRKASVVILPGNGKPASRRPRIAEARGRGTGCLERALATRVRLQRGGRAGGGARLLMS